MLEKKINIPKAFIMFLIVSFFIWLLINLSQKYVTTAVYKVHYSKLAQDKILQKDPVKELELVIKGSGFRLLSANFFGREIQLNIDNLKKKTPNDFYILTNNQRNNIQKQLSSGLKLENISKDTIYLKIGGLKTKKVPLTPVLDIKYRLGYNIAEDIKVTPDSILISGSELQLKNIHSINLKTLTLKDIHKNIDKICTVVLPKNSDKIKTNTKTANVKIVVDKFTEGEVIVPVLIENAPKEKITIFPKTVKVVFNIRLKSFNKITSASFKITCDYQQAKKNDLTYLIPKITLKPEEVSSVRIVPEKIDFLIYK